MAGTDRSRRARLGRGSGSSRPFGIGGDRLLQIPAPVWSGFCRRRLSALQSEIVLGGEFGVDFRRQGVFNLRDQRPLFLLDMRGEALDQFAAQPSEYTPRLRRKSPGASRARTGNDISHRIAYDVMFLDQ